MRHSITSTRRQPKSPAKTCRCPMRPILKNWRCHQWTTLSPPQRPFAIGIEHERCAQENPEIKHGLASRRVPLRRCGVRGAGSRRSRAGGLQLLDVREDRLSPPNRAESTVQIGARRGHARHLHVQHRRGQAHVLQGLRHQIVLRPALAPGRLQRELPLSQSGGVQIHHDHGVRWSALGTACGRTLAAGAELMATNILMPALSPTMEEGKLSRWLVKEGDEVRSGDILAEIETDKATMEFEAVDEGRIAKILVPEGSEAVKVNQPIVVLLGEDEDASAGTAPEPSGPVDISSAMASIKDAVSKETGKAAQGAR